MLNRIAAFGVLLALALTVPWQRVSALGHAQVNSQNLFTRWYEVGERISYKVTGTTADRTGTTSYSATASGVVKRDDMDRFFEELEWSQLASNGMPVQIPQANQPFRQILSLAPDFKSDKTDFSKAHARLVVPAFDLQSIYTDASAAIQQPGLRFNGDRAVVFNHGATNSWADGTRVIVGEDSVDLQLALDEVSMQEGSATLTVLEVPPGPSKVTLPAEWMRTAVSDAPNNWVQVVRTGARQFVASVGKERAQITLQLSLTNGKIFSAEMDDHVDVFERECTDEALTICREGVTYQIVRHIRVS